MQQLLVTKSPDGKDNGLRHNLYAVQEASGKLLPKTELSREVVYDQIVEKHNVFNVYKGKYLDSIDCAVKVVRDIQPTEKRLRRFKREAETWHDLYALDQGKYILPLLGYINEQGKQLYMVSPWMENGTAIGYIRRNPSIDRKKMIRQIAEAVRFIHSLTPPIAHGDLKGENIFINDEGDPLLADFGLSKKVEEEEGAQFTQSQDISDSFRWMAPEIFELSRFSTSSDVYAYAMTVLELMTEQAPFQEIKLVTSVLNAVMKGAKPLRPGKVATDRGLDDNLWNLLQSCWNADPNTRPNINQVIERLPQA